MRTQGSDIIETPEITPKRSHLLEVLATFTRLGLTSFGGPVAHLGYFREEIVIRRKWVDERTYGDLIGLCQFLPGPASSQTGISLGIMRNIALTCGHSPGCHHCDIRSFWLVLI